MSHQERYAWIATAVFVVSIGVLGYLSDGRMFSGTLEFLQGLENSDSQASRNPAANCRDPRNAQLPYCTERRAKSEADWRSITRYQGGKSNAFSLNGKE